MQIFQTIYNLSFLVALSVFSGLIKSYFKNHQLQEKIFQGLLFGIVAIFGMKLPFIVQEGLIFDGRSVVLTLCGFFFGPISAIISGILALIYRIYIGGPGVYMGSSVIIESVIVGLFFYKYKPKFLEYSPYLTFISLGFISSVFMMLSFIFVNEDLRYTAISIVFVDVLFIYPIATFLIGIILFNQENNIILINALNENNQIFKNYLNFTTEAIFFVDNKGNYLSANPMATKITGFTEEEILKKHIGDLATAEDYQKDIEIFEKAINTGYSNGELRFIKKDGTFGWRYIDIIRINDNKYLKFLKDITEQKNKQITIEESLTRFQSIFDLAADSMLITSEDNLKLINCNNSFYEIFGHNPNDLAGKSINSFPFWQNINQKNELLSILEKKGYVRNYEIDIFNFYGDILNCYVSASIIPINNLKFILFIISNQTEKRNIEKELLETTKKYKDFIEDLPDGFYQSTFDGKFIYVNPAFVNMLGYSSKQELMEVDIVKDLYFKPEERDTSSFNDNNILLEYEIFRLKKKDGSEIWIEEHSKYIKDDNGRIIIHEGICRNITDRIRLEKESKELLNRLQKISQNVPGFIYQLCMDKEGNLYFPYASAGVKDIYELTPQEASNSINYLLAEKIHNEDLDKIVNSINYSAEHLSEWHEEYRVNHNDGTYIWVEGNAIPEKQDDGRIIWYGYINDITKRKNDELALKESELSLHFAQEMAKLGHSEYNIATARFKWSRNLYKLFGYEPFSVEPYHQNFVKKTHPDDLEFVKSKILEFNKKYEKIDFQFRIILEENEIRWLQCSFNPIFDNNKISSIHTTFLDITERKNYIDSLRKLTRAIEQNPLGVLITDNNIITEYVNPKFCEMTGLSKEEIIGNNPKILTPKFIENELYDEIRNVFYANQKWEGQLKNINEQGEEYWLNIQITPIKNEDDIINNYILIIEDITEKVKFQEELIKAKEKAEESDRLKSAFLSNMSHEIRTPMNGIIGFSRMLAEPYNTEDDKQEFVRLINFSCDRLINTVNDILDISKIEAKQMELKIHKFNINNIIDELYETHYHRFESKNLYFKHNLINSNSEMYIFSDEQKIFQILNNLISNAYKFTKEGGVEFGYNIINNTEIEFFVSDTGIGIAEENLDLVFQRFTQADNSLSRNYEGTGLGLSICKGLAELINGNITLESKFTEGSTFKLIIPYTKESI